MNEVLGWFGTLGDWILQVVPRLAVLRATDRGVYFTGGEIREIVPRWGLYAWWPVWTEVRVEPANYQAFTMDYRKLRTIDGRDVWVGLKVATRIADICCLVESNFDYAEVVSLKAASATRRVVTLSTFDQLLADGSAEIETRLRAELEEFGLELADCEITDLTCPVMLGHLNDHDHDSGKDYE